MGHEALAADIVADAVAIGAKSGSLFAFRFLPVCGSHQAPPPRGSQAIRMSACALGSARSRPDSHARQKICAGPMIWLKNSDEVIGSNSPRSTSGARHRSTASARREFCARCARIGHSLRKSRQIARLRLEFDPFEMRGSAATPSAPAEFTTAAMTAAVTGEFPGTACRPAPSSIEEMEEAAIGRPRAVLMAATVAPSKPSRSNTTNPAASGSSRAVVIHAAFEPLDYYSRVVL
jgi:hypothetical protein